MSEDMDQARMTEAEVTNNFAAVLEKTPARRRDCGRAGPPARGDHPAAETLRSAILGVHRFGEG
jgi:predicted short-subunit dehydrogenase-like oxidoreductase (DUF2520 family)